MSGKPQFRNPAMLQQPMDGAGMRGSDTIISVPSDGGGDMRPSETSKAGPGIISVPGDSVNLNEASGLRSKSTYSRGIGNLKRKCKICYRKAAKFSCKKLSASRKEIGYVAFVLCVRILEVNQIATLI